MPPRAPSLPRMDRLLLQVTYSVWATFQDDYTKPTELGAGELVKVCGAACPACMHACMTHGPVSLRPSICVCMRHAGAGLIRVMHDMQQGVGRGYCQLSTHACSSGTEPSRA